MESPILFVVSDDGPVLRALKRDLTRRFGKECRIITCTSPNQAISRLESLARKEAPVALLIADEGMTEMSGVDFLEKARALHPRAKRILLVERDYSAANPTVSAMMLGKIDYHLVKPWHPEQALYPAVSEFLAAWADSFDPTFLMFRIVGPEPSPRAHEIRDLIRRFSMPYAYYPADSEEGKRILGEIGRTDAPVPIVVRHDGKVLVDPTSAELIEALGGSTRLGETVYDVAIVGAGPAGLTAAVYAASEGLETIVVEQTISGGQAGTSARIRNFPGFTWGIGGHDFAHRACEQAWLFGANMVFAQEAVGLRTSGDMRIVTVAGESEISARVVVLATGVAWRRLGIPKLESLLGAGVFYGTGASEARAMQGQHVCVVGAGNSAGQAAAHLAKYADSVTLLVRGDSLAKSMSEYLILELQQSPNIRIRMGVEVIDGEGEERLEGVTVRDRATGATERIPTTGLFILIGGEPHTGWLEGVVARHPQGYLLTGTDLMMAPESAGWPMLRPPLHLETSIPGVFAIGDVRFRSVKRVASAVGEGASVVQLLHQYLGEGALASVPPPLGPVVPGADSAPARAAPPRTTAA